MSKTTTPPPQKATSKRQAKPKRPAHLPHGRWLGDFPMLSAAEKALVAACAKGEVWKPVGWVRKRPDAATPANTIRADLIRFLLLGGDAEHPVHEEGVMLGGAWIDDTLNLHQVQAQLRLAMRHCNFVETPIFVNASLPELSLTGCYCPGLRGDGLTIMGGLFLNEDFHASGEVILLGATFGGSLNCKGGRFENAKGNAFSADRLAIKGGLFLTSGFYARGEVRLLGAQIGGDLDYSGGKFENGEGAAFDVSNARVKGNMFLRNADVQGTINLTAAHVETLVDGVTLSCWEGGRHVLDGFRYDRIIGFTDAAQRIEWLELQHKSQLTTNFAPQPWEQLIKVLREMGHPDAASEVAIAKQEQMRTAGVVKGRWRRALHWLYGQLAGYGHRPLLTVRAMVMVWLLGGFAFWAAADGFAVIGPANPVITSATLYPDGDKLCGHGNEVGKARWTECPGVPDEYSTFQPFVYSLDLILPLVDLQQDSDWAPIAEGPTGDDLLPGMLARWLMWFEILFGWAMSLMLVAVLGRLVDKD